MNNFQQYDEDPVPEGLEFNESYMEQAFAMYDAEKAERKRRLLFWWFSAMGIIFIVTALVAIMYFGGSETQTAQKHSSRSAQIAGDQQMDKRAEHSVSDNVKPSAVTSVATEHSSKHESRASSGKTVTTGSAPEDPVKKIIHYDRRGEGTPVEPEALVVDGSPSRTAAKLRTKNLLSRVQFEPNLQSETTVLKSDSIENLLLAQRMDSLKKQHIDSLKMKHYLYLSMGGNLLFGMRDLTGGLHIRETFGLGYNYMFSRNFYAGLAAEYHSVSRIDYNRYVGASYDNTPSQTYTLKTTLNYVSVVPSIGVLLNKNNSLTLGFSMDYLLPDAEQRLSARELEVDKDAINKFSEEDYYSVFSRFNCGVSLGYQVRLSRFVELNANYTYGLTDVTKNSYSDAFNRNSRLQLGLRFRMF